MKSFLFFSLLLSVSAAAQSIDMTPAHWQNHNSDASFVVHDQRHAVKMSTGTLWLKDITMSAGQIEVDIAATERGFPGLVFHDDGKGNSEQVYLRLHKSRQADAIQYTPHFNEESAWQLYPEHQVNYTYPTTGWIRLKIVVQNNEATVFIDTATQPVLIIPYLRTGHTQGKIGLWTNGPVIFSRFAYTPLPDNVVNQRTYTMPTNSKVIHTYSLSSAMFIPKDVTAIPYPASQSSLQWNTVTTEPDGLLNINRYRTKKEYGRFEKNSNDAVYIKHIVESERDELRKLDFEFTNRCWIYVNGQLVYSGNNTFRARGALYRGEIDKKIGSQSLYLPLRKGKNEILVAVSSVANGWGWMAKWDKL